MRLGDYFGKKPVVLTLVYYECPMLCTLTLNGLVSALNALSFDAGKEFEVVTVSFEPRETPALAAAKKDAYLERYQRPGARGRLALPDRRARSRSRALTQAVGFRYAWDERTPQFAHPAGVVVLTPEGRIARYLFGIEYAPKDLRLRARRGLGRAGSAASSTRLLLYCYQYDPTTGRYGTAIMRLLRVAALLTLGALGGVHLHDVAARAQRRARGPRRERQRLAMWSGFPLFPEQASTIAGQVDALYFFLIALTAFFCLLIAAAGGRLRRSATAAARRTSGRPAIHGSLALELTWTLIPLAIVVVIFVWSADLFVTLHRACPTDAMEVYVVGKRWMWKLQHMTGQREINELHVPVGVPVKLTLTSEDVIHSFFVPAFRVKKDAVPGRYTTAWFEATKPGRYHLFCAEYCGTRALGHDRHGRGAWSRRRSRPGSRAARPAGRSRRRGEKLFQDLGLRHLPPARTRGARGPQPRRALRPAGARSRTARPSRPTRPTSASRS